MPPPQIDPALVFESGLAGAGTHVLLVGIGAYTSLLDGEAEHPAIADGMGQLTPPPHSVKALADWFLSDDFVNPDHPLASLAVVVSDEEPWNYQHPQRNRGAGPVPRGNIQDVVDAIHNWVERASQCQDCNTIFYFCGHGAYAGNTVLLCRDYGNVVQNRFDGSLNFDNFAVAMETKEPERQLFIVDACRTPDRTTDLLLNQLQGSGRNPITPRSLHEHGGNLARLSVHFASSALEPSYGRTDNISICADALLRALAGGGSQSEDDMWVGTNGIHDAFSTYIPRLARVAGAEQEPDRKWAKNFRISKPEHVMVPVYVTCNPEEAWQSPFSLGAACDGGASSLIHEHDPIANPGALEAEIPLVCGQYRFTAAFGPQTPFADGMRDRVLVIPPAMPVRLDIQRRNP